ncbi:MAG: YfcE family phosphodiesterase [Spirochaetales bacterium]|jgi:putative phosphoesterase|nr:YfcE family phosphodiesterase [Exilispira sp.]NMC66927.1 YfcE family phosphodiesterase [Spirochaetales bacterium]
MKRLLIISDIHYPTRTKDSSLIKHLENLIKENDITIGCGDYVSDNIVALIETLSKNSYLVKGNMDFFERNLPEKLYIEIENLKIGIIHGSGSPLGIEGRIIRRFDTKPNIIFFGHTHIKENKNIDGISIINPGAFCDGSYCICEIDGDKIDVKFIKTSLKKLS